MLSEGLLAKPPEPSKVTLNRTLNSIIVPLMLSEKQTCISTVTLNTTLENILYTFPANGSKRRPSQLFTIFASHTNF